MKFTLKQALLSAMLTCFCFFLAIPAVRGQVVINEYSVSNLADYPDNHLAYEDWFELYNAGSSAVVLDGYHLSDKLTNPTKWTIPTGVSIPAGGILRFWASGRDEVVGSHYHTNFKLHQTKSSPEHVVLADPTGMILEQAELENTQLGHSRGLTTDGGPFWGVFINPTPNASNNSSTNYFGYAERPTIDTTAGFYPGAMMVSVTSNEPNATIRYTVNGLAVTNSSQVYSGPVNISQTAVLKVRVFSNSPNTLPSLHEFKTFFINETHVLPVVSVAGNDLLGLANGNKNLRPVGSIEYFNENGVRTTEGYGELNSHGQDSWVHPQRSLDWVTRDEMGYSNALKEKLFPFSDRDKFQRVILRCEGDDNYPGNDSAAHMRDMYVHTICARAGMPLDVRKAAKCVVYLDGNYWGVYSLREKVDDPDFTKEYYDQDKYNLEMLLTWGNTWIEYGGTNVYNDWQTLANFILTQDMSVAANYDQVTAQMDVKSLTDYCLTNSYVVCSDWLNYNTGWWRGLNTDGGHQRWGYIMWDDDATFDHYINYTGIASTQFNADPCQHEDLIDNWSDPERHIRLLNKLRDNADFDQYYVSRYIDLMNSAFSCDAMTHVLDSIVNVVTPEMARHSTRWGGSFAQWETNVVKLRDFVEARCAYVKTGLNGCYGLTGPDRIAFNVEPANAGWVDVNSLRLKNFPWAGDYYQGIPVLLKAIDYDTTYIFDHWELVNHTVSPYDTLTNVTLNVTQSDSVVAHFRIRNPVAVTDPAYAEYSMDVFPNPFNKATTVRVDPRAKADKLVVFDLLGKPVQELRPRQGNEFEISRAGMANGIYLFRVYDKKSRPIGTGKLIVE